MDSQVKIHPLLISLLNIISYKTFEAEASWLRATRPDMNEKGATPGTSPNNIQILDHEYITVRSA